MKVQIQTLDDVAPDEDFDDAFVVWAANIAAKPPFGLTFSVSNSFSFSSGFCLAGDVWKYECDK